jgi:predicted ATPase/transcriptional regulator with XRE-family HTH domain
MGRAEPNSFGQLLRRYRTAGGLTQEELAERAGLSARGVQDLERGLRRGPHLDTTRRLVEALGLGQAQRAELLDAVDRAASSSGGAAVAPLAVAALPLSLTSFVGRDAELSEVTALLAGARLLTLTGVGGCGKTRLALEVARAVVPSYPDGVWLVELGPLADPRLVPQRVGAVVGVRETPDQSLTTALATALASRRLLLVLDNCEHLLQACAVLVDALLCACPDLHILATSREPIGIGGEVAWRIPSLSMPDPEQPASVAAVQQSPAVQLFVERASAARPAFRLTDRNAAAVAQICWRLDGIPLALELAATRLEALSPGQLAARLDQRFRLLTGGSRAALPRQQTLQATLDWSYDLLSKPERRLFERLAVFAGSWTLDAAESVCAGGGLAAEDALDLLARLVRKSLVVATEAADEAERYRLLETVREYARQKLLTRGVAETTAVRERHAAFYSAQAARLSPGVGFRAGWAVADPAAEAVRRQIEELHDNLQVALGWWLAACRAGEGLSLAVTLCQFWMWSGMYAEARRWLEPMLDLATANPAPTDTAGPAVPPALRAWALQLLGTVTNRQGEYAQARAFSEACVALLRELEDTAALPTALAVLGQNLWLAGAEGRAIAVLEESLRLGREIGQRGAVAMALRHLGLCARWQAQYERAGALLRESLAEAGWPVWKRGHHIARGLSNLGRVAHLQTDYPRARTHLCQALEVIRASRLLGQPLADSLDWVAALAASQGEPVRAATLFGAAEARWRAMGGVRYAPDRPAYERDVTNVRAQLDAESLVAAWAEGQAMSPDRAIAYALVQVPS